MAMCGDALPTRPGAVREGAISRSTLGGAEVGGGGGEGETDPVGVPPYTGALPPPPQPANAKAIAARLDAENLVIMGHLP